MSLVEYIPDFGTPSQFLLKKVWVEMKMDFYWKINPDNREKYRGSWKSFSN